MRRYTQNSQKSKQYRESTHYSVIIVVKCQLLSQGLSHTLLYVVLLTISCGIFTFQKTDNQKVTYVDKYFANITVNLAYQSLQSGRHNATISLQFYSVTAALSSCHSLTPMMQFFDSAILNSVIFFFLTEKAPFSDITQQNYFFLVLKTILEFYQHM